MTITGEQVTEARKVLGWTLLDIAFRAGVSETPARMFEAARRSIGPDEALAIQRTF